jgi:hypothetical protein
MNTTITPQRPQPVWSTPTSRPEYDPFADEAPSAPRDIVEAIGEKNTATAKPGEAYNAMFSHDFDFATHGAIAKRIHHGGPVGASDGEFLSHFIKGDAGARTMLGLVSYRVWYAVGAYETNLHETAIENLRDVADALEAECWPWFGKATAKAFQRIHELKTVIEAHDMTDESRQRHLEHVSEALTFLDAVESYVKRLRCRDNEFTWTESKETK